MRRISIFMLFPFTTLFRSPKYIGDLGFSPMGGAVGRVKPEATAFWNRNSNYMIMLHGAWMDPSLDSVAVEGGRHIWQALEDRKSTRLNSSHPSISYAVFCL